MPDLAATILSHRLVRSAIRKVTYRHYGEGLDVTTSDELYHEASCSCGEVFQGQDEREVSGKYLLHLPTTTKEG